MRKTETTAWTFSTSSEQAIYHKRSPLILQHIDMLAAIWESSVATAWSNTTSCKAKAALVVAKITPFHSFAAVKLNGDHVAFLALLEKSHLIGSEKMAHP